MDHRALQAFGKTSMLGPPPLRLITTPRLLAGSKAPRHWQNTFRVRRMNPRRRMHPKWWGNDYNQKYIKYGQMTCDNKGEDLPTTSLYIRCSWCSSSFPGRCPRTGPTTTLHGTAFNEGHFATDTFHSSWHAKRRPRNIILIMRIVRQA